MIVVLTQQGKVDIWQALTNELKRLIEGWHCNYLFNIGMKEEWELIKKASFLIKNGISK